MYGSMRACACVFMHARTCVLHHALRACVHTHACMCACISLSLSLMYVCVRARVSVSVTVSVRVRACVSTSVCAYAFVVVYQDAESVAVDTSERCFVCTLERSVFEMYGNGFEAHTKDEHNPMVYMFYWYFIYTKTTRTAFEENLYDNMIQGEELFMPVQQSCAIVNRPRTSIKLSEESVSAMDTMQTEVTSLSKGLGKLEGKLSFINRRFDNLEQASGGGGGGSGDGDNDDAAGMDKEDKVDKDVILSIRNMLR